MNLRAERIYLARRDARIARLIGLGWTSDQAEAGMVAWEAHATDRDRALATYWDGAEEWVLAWRQGSR